MQKCSVFAVDDVETMERLEKIMDSLREIVTEVAIVEYPGKVA